MKGALNKPQIDYLFFHFQLHFELTQELRDRIRCVQAGADEIIEPGSLVFSLSSEPYAKEKVRYRGELPVLFPMGDSEEFFVWENGSLVFPHDLLKSAFILLSGYQESLSHHRDSANRFQYHDSIQQQLGIEHLPLVNYYFRLIEDGIQEFCGRVSLPFKKKRLFDTLGFMLSHDVDVIDTYTFNDLIYSMKKVLGLVPVNHSLPERIKFFWKYLFNYLKVSHRPNPHWDFEYLVHVARKHGFKSVFYFLHKDLKHQDSYYDFEEKRIQELFSFLLDEGCEIGLHGSSRSADNRVVLADHLGKLEKVLGSKVKGIRQHRLIHIFPDTPRLHQEFGFSYDASLGFAEHEGFRNSFCMPFKLYDFENDTMLDVWEIPLLVMDATLYKYRKLDHKAALNSVKRLVSECRKFGGLFTLLWHNGNFDAENYPGGMNLFEEILQYLETEKCKSVSGIECIEAFIMPIFNPETHKEEQ